MRRHLSWTIGLLLSSSLLPVQALETLRFSANGDVQELAIADLAILAERGQPPRPLQPLLQQAGLNSQSVQRFLNSPLPLSGSQLLSLLELGFGDRLVQELSRILGAKTERMQNPDRWRNRLAILGDQSSISVLQLLQVLPAQSLAIDVPRLLQVLSPLQNQFRALGLELADVVPCLSDRSCASR